MQLVHAWRKPFSGAAFWQSQSAELSREKRVFIDFVGVF
jgi:hypothetical protein